MKSLFKNPKLILLSILTLGLAPYVPEPHFFGKVRWVWGGAVGMTGMDWFDLFLHGIPWLLGLIWLILWASRLAKRSFS